MGQDARLTPTHTPTPTNSPNLHPPAPEWGGPNRPSPSPSSSTHSPSSSLQPTNPSSSPPSSDPLLVSAQPQPSPYPPAPASAPTSPPPPPVDPKIDFLAGTIGGAAGLIVGQPFDTIKVRWQVRGVARSGSVSASSSVLGNTAAGLGGVQASGRAGGIGAVGGAGTGVGVGVGAGGGAGGGGAGAGGGGGGVWSAIRGIVRDEGVS